MANAQAPIQKQASGDLTGTMTPAGVLSLMQAAQQQQSDLLTQQAQAAAQQANQAQQQYQQAAQAPPPDLGGASLIPSLAGNFASVFSGNPQYQQQAQSDLRDQKATLLQARQQNLAALHDVYAQKAKHAEDLGDLETTEKYRTKMETLGKALDQVNTDLARREQTRQFGVTQRNDMAQSLIGKGVNPGPQFTGFGKAGELLPYVEKSRMTVLGGQDPEAVLPAVTIQTDYGNVVDATGFSPKDRPAMIMAAKEAGLRAITDPKEKQALNDIDTARKNMFAQYDSIKGYLSDKPDLWSVMKTAGTNEFKKWVLGNPDLRAFDAFWANTVRSMRAQAGSGGLRINRSEIERALNWDRPNLQTDSQAVLDQKMKNWEILFRNGMMPLMSNDWRGGAINTAFNTNTKTVTVMAPDGSTSEMPFAKAQDVLSNPKSGYARVIVDTSSPNPPSAAPSGPAPDTAQAAAPDTSITAEVWVRDKNGKPKLVRR